MSQRYQREIEEILRNMEETDPHPAERRKSRAASEPRPKEPRKPRAPIAMNLSGVFLLAAVITVFIAACVFWYVGHANEWTGLLGLLALVFTLVGLTIGWVREFRPTPPSMWRGNVIEMHQPRGSRPSFLQRFRLWQMRQRYRRDGES